MSATSDRPGNARARIICCGCRAEAVVGADRDGRFSKPRSWFARTDDDGTQLACCRECIETVAKATGKTGVILPI